MSREVSNPANRLRELHAAPCRGAGVIAPGPLDAAADRPRLSASRPNTRDAARRGMPKRRKISLPCIRGLPASPPLSANPSASIPLRYYLRTVSVVVSKERGGLARFSIEKGLGRPPRLGRSRNIWMAAVVAAQELGHVAAARKPPSCVKRLRKPCMRLSPTSFPTPARCDRRRPGTACRRSARRSRVRCSRARLSTPHLSCRGRGGPDRVAAFVILTSVRWPSRTNVVVAPESF